MIKILFRTENGINDSRTGLLGGYLTWSSIEISVWEMVDHYSDLRNECDLGCLFTQILSIEYEVTDNRQHAFLNNEYSKNLLSSKINHSFEVGKKRIHLRLQCRKI